MADEYYPSVTLDTRSYLSRDEKTQIVVVSVLPDTQEGTRGLNQDEFGKIHEALAKREVWPPLGYALYQQISMFVFEIAPSTRASAVEAFVYAELMNERVYAPLEH